MTSERIPLRKVEFPQAKNIHGKTFQQLPGQSTGRNRLQDLTMQYLPDLEMVEIDASNFPRILVPINQVSYMEPVQDKAALPTPGPEVITTEQLAELQKAAEPVNLATPPPAGARSSLDAPTPKPDLRPPPKYGKGLAEKVLPTQRTVQPLMSESPKPDRFAKVGKKKRGRPKKVK